MSEYQLKAPKQAEAVARTCHKVEDAAVGAYKKVEDTVVGGYKAIEKRFVDTFLERADGGGDGQVPPDTEGVASAAGADAPSSGSFAWGRRFNTAETKQKQSANHSAL